MIRLLSIVIMITISSTAFSRDIYGYIKGASFKLITESMIATSSITDREL